MSRKVPWAAVLVCAVGFGFVWLGSQSAAQGQKEEKAQQWQYQIYMPTDADFASSKAATEFNKLGADGWEFVGTIVSRMKHEGAPLAGPVSEITGRTCVLFKRIKR